MGGHMINRKKIYIGTIAILLIFCIFLVVVVNHNMVEENNINNSNVDDITNLFSDFDTFNVNDYQHYIDNYPSKKMVGNYSSIEDLLEKVELIWIETFGDGIKEEKPFSIQYDKNNNVILVKSSPRDVNSFGGEAVSIINYDGQVLAIWHYK